MKLGTFVGRNFLPVTEEEMNFVTSKINEALKESFNDYENYTIDSNEYMNIITLKIYGLVSDEMRDTKGNTYIPCYMMLTFTKQSGYDEKVHGKSYEFEDGFEPPCDIISYSCSIDLIGHCREYKKKNVYSYVGITKTSYLYGTELEDVDCKESIMKIGKYISTSKPNTGTPIELYIKKEIK